MDIGKIIMKKLLLSFILSLTLSFPALAINIRDTNIIHIYFDDSARGGCWTNLSEVRNYVKGSLESKGGIVARDPNVGDLVTNGSYRLNITVVASRLYTSGDGPCIGSVSARLDGLAYVNSDPIWAVFSEDSGVKADNTNLNQTVLSFLSDFLRTLD